MWAWFGAGRCLSKWLGRPPGRHRKNRVGRTGLLRRLGTVWATGMTQAATAPRRVAYRAEAEVRRPDGAPVDLGGWVSNSPGWALGWVRERAEHVAQQLGTPYDGTMRAWLNDVVRYRSGEPAWRVR